MIPLPTKLRKDGFDLTQVCREGNVAIYAQSKGGCVYSYEVILVREEKEKTMFGRFVPAHEAYPRSEDWGRLAWTCLTLERAKERFRGLCTLSPPGDAEGSVRCPDTPQPSNSKR